MPKEYSTVLSDQLLEKLVSAAEVQGGVLDDEELSQLAVEGLELALARLGEPGLASVHQISDRRRAR